MAVNTFNSSSIVTTLTTTNDTTVIWQTKSKSTSARNVNQFTDAATSFTTSTTTTVIPSTTSTNNSCRQNSQSSLLKSIVNIFEQRKWRENLSTSRSMQYLICTTIILLLAVFLANNF